MDNARYTVVVNGREAVWYGFPREVVIESAQYSKRLNPGAGVYAIADNGEIIYSRRGDEDA